jgi:hypothetical protein
LADDELNSFFRSLRLSESLGHSQENACRAQSPLRGRGASVDCA